MRTWLSVLAALRYVAAGIGVMALMSNVTVVRASEPCALRFAPENGVVAPLEKPLRDELCLNGKWQFQPVPIPAGYVRDQGTPPDLAPPAADRWEATPIKIPSPWNVNAWGGGRDVGAGSPHPYWPGSVVYPSYPASWDGVEMGWLRRTFRVPTGASWAGKRLRLHFEAVAGECEVRVNGVKVGEHFDSYLPFDCDVTGAVRPGADNELRVGVRRRHLFNKTEVAYPRMRAPYAVGSNTDALGGIWQDVSLVAVAPVHVEDAFVKPLVGQDRLEVAVTVANDGAVAQTVSVGGTVAPWVNRAGTSIADAPVPQGELGATTLTLPAARVTVPPGGTATLTFAATVGGKLALWSPAAPHLNGLTLTVNSTEDGGRAIDRHFTRFGWREVRISGQDVTLNGKKINLFSDLVHPFGAWVMSRRYAWAWYRMVKDMGGNAVRLHAQPMPGYYLDMADEMGILVLDETALFGSSLQLNFNEPVAWDRFADHYDNLVRRDRNHPSVFGWSFGNELFAIFDYNKAGQPQSDRWHAQLTALGLRAQGLDPTRQWIGCDGDEDLRGTLPVWSKHFGDGLRPNDIPRDLPKPRMVGESGGTYYAKPPLLAKYGGDRAYVSYAGRDEALAIDLYQNVVKTAMANNLAFYSASETVWFGLEHLPYGYDDFARLPNADDGIVFTHPYEEGVPGYQPERLPPYVATLNPGWDARLPLYRPLAMFDAFKAALAPSGPAPSPWDHVVGPTTHSAPPAPTTTAVAFVGPDSSPLRRQLARWGVPVVTGDAASAAKLLVIDAASLTPTTLPGTRARLTQELRPGGTALVLGVSPDALGSVNELLPLPIALTDRMETMLVPRDPSPWTASVGMPDLYFAENDANKHILTHGMTGAFVSGAKTLLEGGNIDWTLFDNGEAVKCGALVLYEHLKKPEGAAFVVRPSEGGQIAVSTIDATTISPAHAALWRKLLVGMGVALLPMGAPHDDAPKASGTPAAEHDLLRDGPQAAPTVTPAKPIKPVVPMTTPSTTLRRSDGNDIVGHVIAGYQGWFALPGDGSPVGKLPAGHGNYHSNLETYPDMREFPRGEQFPNANGYPALPNGNPSTLFASDRDFTADLHTRWMRQYGVDVAAIQRFGEVAHDPTYAAQKNDVTLRMMRAGERNGVRCYIEYDGSGSGGVGWGDDFVQGIEKDWTDFAVAQHIVDSPAYARQGGKPVVELWGIGLRDNNIATDPARWRTLIEWFKAKGCYVIAGTAGGWREGVRDGLPGFGETYAACDAINPWTVGRYHDVATADRYAADFLVPDAAWCKAHKIDYIPVIYPGTAFFNSNNKSKNVIPRQHGEFMWEQFANLRRAQIGTCFVAMFDEFNEATAIAKSAEDTSMVPADTYFLTLDADGTPVSSDFYLRLTRDGAAMITGRTPLQATLPTPFRNDLFATGFEPTEPRPTWIDTPDDNARNANVAPFGGASRPECSPRTGEKSQSGVAALLFSGTANGGVTTGYTYKVFDLTAHPVTLDSHTLLTYWLYPESDNARYVALDLHFTDGTMLSQSACVDQNGKSLAAASGHGGDITLQAWSVIASNLGALAGKTVDRVTVTFDRPGASGTYRGYLDDVRISH